MEASAATAALVVSSTRDVCPVAPTSVVGWMLDAAGRIPGGAEARDVVVGRFDIADGRVADLEAADRETRRGAVTGRATGVAGRATRGDAQEGSTKDDPRDGETDGALMTHAAQGTERGERGAGREGQRDATARSAGQEAGRRGRGIHALANVTRRHTATGLQRAGGGRL